MANRVIVVRHEISSDNVKGIVQGDSDPPLKQRVSPRRIYELTDKIAREIGAGSQVYVYSSNSIRAYETGEGIHDRLWNEWKRMSHVHYTPDLRERGQGVLEGKNYAQVLAMLQREPISDPDEARREVLRFLYESDNDPGQVPKVPGQVPKSEMRKRLEKVVDEFDRTDGVVIAVGHSISGLNYLVNLMTTNDIMGEPFQDHLNLYAVVLDRNGVGQKYVKTKNYEPPNGHTTTGPIPNGGNGVSTTLAKTG